MKHRLQIGYLLLIAPLLIWLFVLFMSLDESFNRGILMLAGPAVVTFIFITGGFVFPLISLVIGISGLKEQTDKGKNHALISFSTVFLIGMVVALVMRLL